MLHPIVTPELISKLRSVFPSTLSRRHTDQELHYIVGQQEVINYLQQLLETEAAGDLDPEAI